MLNYESTKVFSDDFTIYCLSECLSVLVVMPIKQMNFLIGITKLSVRNNNENYIHTTSALNLLHGLPLSPVNVPLQSNLHCNMYFSICVQKTKLLNSVILVVNA